MTAPPFRSFPTSSELFSTLANALAARLAAAIEARSRASLVVSGGSTPAELFDRLHGCELAWNKVTVTLADERWVSPASDRSNEKLVRARLLKDRAALAQFVPLKSHHAHAAEAETEINARIAGTGRPFDVVLLGMGGDGHTASLIPHAEGLAAALDLSQPQLVRSIVPPAETAMGERMTLTLRALLESRMIYILIRGEEKRLAYERALGGRELQEMPVRGVLSQRSVPVETFWSA